jgi:hypothetical protein
MTAQRITLALCVAIASCAPGKQPTDACPPSCTVRIAKLEKRIVELEATVEKQNTVLKREGLLAADGSVPAGKPRCIETGNGVVEITRAGIDEIDDDPGLLLTQAEVKPSYDENLVFRGYAIKALDPSSIIHECGLRQGDVIHTVNGHVLASPGDFTNVQQRLEKEAEVVWELVARDARIDVLIRRKSTSLELTITGIQPLLDSF